MIFRRVFILLLLYGIVWPKPSIAGWCVGVPDRVQLVKDGRVELISQGLYQDGHGRQICHLKQEWKGVAKEACVAWYSAILAAMVQKTKVMMQYPPNDHCQSQLHWGNAEPPHMISNYN